MVTPLVSKYVFWLQIEQRNTIDDNRNEPRNRNRLTKNVYKYVFSA